MKKHPVYVEGFEGSLETLAKRVGKMRYDRVAEFLYYFAKELLNQSNGDKKAKRVQLALMLTGAWGIARALQMQVENIFFLCAPHMKREVGANPQLGYDDEWKKPANRLCSLE